MVALAALRTGVDLAFIASPEKTAHAISSMSPSLITLKLKGEHLNPRNVDAIAPMLGKVTGLVMGPGLGLHEESAETVNRILELAEKAGVPVLLDADALKAFAGFKRRLKTKVVLTPHAGEYKILTGESPPDDLNARIEHAKRSARELESVILLKARALRGSVDIISNGREVKLNSTGNPGMTVGGTGDTLSGIVGAFLAQGADPFEAASAGAFLNGATGDFAASERGYHLLPSDLIDWIPRVMDDPMSHLKVRRT
jgi:NAD(P)H-hydrate epimerase